MVLHVDDQNVFASTLLLLLEFKAALKAQHSIDDIGETKHFLVLEVSRNRSRQTIKLWQPKYISDTVARFEILNFGLVSTPTNPRKWDSLSRDQCPKFEEGNTVQTVD